MRISIRDVEHPLSEQTLIEFGCGTSNPNGLRGAVVALGEMLGQLKTPERVAEFMRDNAALAEAKHLILERN